MNVTLLAASAVAESMRVAARHVEAQRERARIGRPPRYVVRLSDEERTELLALTRTGRSAAQRLLHAWILLHADRATPSTAGGGWDDAEISAALRVSLSTILRVRRAYVEAGLDAALDRRPSATPRPTKLDGAAEARLVTLACSAPPAGHARWTLRLLADRFVELEAELTADAGASDDPPLSVSYELVRRTLKKTRSSRG